MCVVQQEYEADKAQWRKEKAKEEGPWRSYEQRALESVAAKKAQADKDNKYTDEEKKIIEALNPKTQEEGAELYAALMRQREKNYEDELKEGVEKDQQHHQDLLLKNADTVDMANTRYYLKNRLARLGGGVDSTFYAGKTKKGSV